MSTIVLKVNGVDKSNQVDWASVTKEEVLTKEPDSLSFLIRNYTGKTYRPAIGDEVTLYNDVTLIFGGVVIETRDTLDGGLLKHFLVKCKDYTQYLDRYLVAKTYEAMTIDDIIADILVEFTDGTITDTNVVAPILVEKVVFNYLTVSQALQKLTEVVGGYDWYIDYSKDIHFFQNTVTAAPFSLDDTGGNFNYQSLELKQDNSQLRNSITVRGGDFEGTAVDNQQVADGVQRVFFVGYDLTSFLAYKALAASPTSFVALTVGADGKDNPASFDTLYNPNNGLLIFPESSKPAIDDVIKYTGIPIFPLITQQQDIASVAANGEYEYVIIDKTIRSKEAAIQRALAELLKYSTVLSKGTFDTRTSGLRTGQLITIACTLRGISGTYKIERITTVLRTPSSVTSDLLFRVSFVSTVDVTLVDVLNKLLIKDPANQLDIGQNEVIARIYTKLETITLSEVTSTSQSHNPQTETITAGEASNAVKDLGTIFVVGEYVPVNFADTKRMFLLDSSPLG